MASYVYDGTAVGDAKVNLNPIPGGGLAVNYVDEDDWNEHRQFLIDLRDAINGGDYYGFASQSSLPTPTQATNFLWYSDTGELMLKTASGSARVACDVDVENVTGDHVLGGEAIVHVNATGNDVDVTLPLIADVPSGRTVFIRRTDASAFTVQALPSGANTINGLASIEVTTASPSVILISDGSNNWVTHGGGGVTLSDTKPQDLVDVNAAAGPGTSGEVSRQDHVHAHGSRGGGSLHIVAVAGAPGTNGFLTGVDKQWIDTHSTDTGNPHGVTKSQVSLGNVDNLLNNWAGGRAPIATDDSNAGYAIGSRWLDETASPKMVYTCALATVGAAEWVVGEIDTHVPVQKDGGVVVTDPANLNLKGRLVTVVNDGGDAKVTVFDTMRPRTQFYGLRPGTNTPGAELAGFAEYASDSITLRMQLSQPISAGVITVELRTEAEVKYLMQISFAVDGAVSFKKATGITNEVALDDLLTLKVYSGAALDYSNSSTEDLVVTVQANVLEKVS